MAGYPRLDRMNSLPHLCAEVSACVPPEAWDGPVIDLLDEAFSTNLRATVMEQLSKLKEENDDQA